MEQFTHNRDEFILHIRKELSEYEPDSNWNEIFSYVELPLFLNYGWSYNWSKNVNTPTFRLLRKEWDAKYDLDRFKSGIYNLDRLAIREKEIFINPTNEDILIGLGDKILDQLWKYETKICFGRR